MKLEPLSQYVNNWSLDKYPQLSQVLRISIIVGFLRSRGWTIPSLIFISVTLSCATPITIPQEQDQTGVTGTPARTTEEVRMPDTVTAQVILRSASGLSILDADEPITSENISKYQAEEGVIQNISAKLQELGFTVGEVSPTSLTISGSKRLFEDVFQTTLEVESTGQATTPFYKNTAPVVIPADFSTMIADVTFSVPPTFYP